MGTGKKMNIDVLLRGISMLVEFPGFSALRLAVNFPEKLPYMSVDMYLL